MNPLVLEKFSGYPEEARTKLQCIRALIFELSAELNLGEVEEALKWGEPSYSVKSGSPIRFDWKAKSPEYYYLFFNCKSKLVDTFRELYSDTLVFQGNRAIELKLSEPLPEAEIKHCLELALTYHKIKHLPLLGA